MSKLCVALCLASAAAFTGPSAKLPAQPTRAAATTAAPEMVVKVGVIGAGRIGIVHLEALSQTQDAARAGVRIQGSRRAPRR